MAFEREVRAYEALLPTLLPQAGKYVVIKDEELLGTFDGYEEALKAGYEKFGLTPFFVRQIAVVPNVAYFSRDLVGCHQ